MLEKKVVKVEPEYDDWLEGYNMAITGDEKKKYLDRGLAESESEENLLRRKLYEKRYLKDGKLTGFDAFMREWKNMEFLIPRLDSRFGRKKALAELEKIREYMLMDEGRTPELRRVLFLEYVNLISVYLAISCTDNNYTSVIFGFGTMKKGKLMKKLAEDIAHVGIGVPTMAGQTKEFELLMSATKEAFLTMYPGEEETWNEAEALFRN